MRLHVLFVFAIFTLTVNSAKAGTDAEDAKPASSAKAPAALMPQKMSCAEFLAMGELYRPRVVYWSEGLNRGRKINAEINVDKTNRLLPLLVDDCKREPRASYWAKMKKRFDVD